MSRAFDVIGDKQKAAQKLAGRFFDNAEVKMLAQRDVNTTFLAQSGKTKLIIRLAEKETLGRRPIEGFHKASKAAELVEAAGIKTRKILLTGESLVPYAYQITDFIDGKTGEEFKGDDIKIWEQIGQVAKRINLIKTYGYGDKPFSRPAQTWKDYITKHINGVIKFQQSPSNPRVTQKVMFSPTEIKQVHALLQPLKGLVPDLRLIHGDLGPHNVIVDKKGKIIAVIDWDLAKSFPAEHQVALCTFWNSYISPKPQSRLEAFMKGYGETFDPVIIRSFQIYEYLTQLPFHSHQAEIQTIILSLLEAGRKNSRNNGNLLLNLEPASA